MKYTNVFSSTLSSVVHNNEICEELVKIGEKENYPIKKAKLYSKLGKYIGFSVDHMITAKRLPPIPGGWEINIKKFEPDMKKLILNVVKEIDKDGKEIGKVNKLVLNMFEEYKKEGLEITIEDEVKEFYGNPVRIVNAIGHPILLDSLEEFVDNMR